MNTGDRISDYIIERVLGEGGMGEVYLARHTVLDQQVAIKILDPEVARKSGVRERFIQEANIQAKLKHPHIVQVLTATKTDGGTPALIMEYVDGKSLSEVLELRGALPLDDALMIMEQVLSAVGYAHRQGVIHRDLKPSNVMVMASGEVKVTDFGIAKVLGSSKLTRTGTAMGSAHYMSPEQIRRPETVDARSDVYSLGCVFYEVLTGRPPFGDSSVSGTDSDFEIKEGHVRGQIPQVHDLRQDVPDWLERLVMQSLAKEPDSRPSSCEEMLAQITGGRGLVMVEKNVLIPGEPAGAAAKKSAQSGAAAESKHGRKKSKLISRGLLAIAFAFVVCASVVLILGKETYKNFIEPEVTENTGKFVINPQFDEARNFSEGLAAVLIAGKYGFIDKEGKMVIPPQFDSAYGFSEGLAAVLKAGKYGFIDKEGKMVIPPQFDSTYGFFEGLAAVLIADKYGFIDKGGKMISPPQFDLADPFSEGLAAVQIAGKHGFIDKEGKMVILPQFESANSFSEGLAAVEIAGKQGFINKDGKIVIFPEFEYVTYFSEGLAVVRIGGAETGKYGFINRDGKLVISPQFEFVLDFSEGLAAVRIGDEETGKYGFINKDGKIVISPSFDADGFLTDYRFKDGFAAVRIGDLKSGKKGFIARR